MPSLGLLLALFPAPMVAQPPLGPLTFQSRDLAVLSACGAPAISGTYRVLHSGLIDVPQIGQITVATRTPDQVAKLIEKECRTLLGRVVDVEVRLVVDKESLVTLRGAVPRPIEFLPHKGWTVKDVLEWSNLKASPDQVRHRTGAGELMPPGTPLKPGDRIWVMDAVAVAPITLLGGINNPGSFDYRPGLTLGEAINSLGKGMAVRGIDDRIFIVRGTQTLGPFQYGKDNPIKVQPGDTVRIEVQEEIKFVAVNGLVKTPMLVPFKPGLTLFKALEAAGGVLDEKAIIRVYSLSDLSLKEIRFPFADIQSGKQQDFPLVAGMSVSVVQK